MKQPGLHELYEPGSDQTGSPAHGAAAPRDVSVEPVPPHLCSLIEYYLPIAVTETDCMTAGRWRAWRGHVVHVQIC